MQMPFFFWDDRPAMTLATPSTSSLRILNQAASEPRRASFGVRDDSTDSDDSMPDADADLRLVESEADLLQAEERVTRVSFMVDDSEKPSTSSGSVVQRMARSHSLPSHLLDQMELEEKEAIRTAFEAELVSHEFESQCRCPTTFSGDHFIFQLMNAPCFVCGFWALFAFVTSRPLHPEIVQPSHRLICDIHHHSVSPHNWWHHIGRSYPEIHMDSLQLILHNKYPGEEHTVTTDDGFILRIHRIPDGQFRRATAGVRKPVVFLQHGLEGSSADWITNHANQSAGFMLADAGFDVWLGNFRGNQYALRHTCYTPEDNAFWEFSWDQMARYDLDAMIDYVLQETGESSLHYVGHSQGSLTAYAKMASDPKFSRKLKSMMALAPVVTLRHIRGFLKYIAVFTNPMQKFFDIFGVKQFLPNNWVSKLIAKTVCEWEGSNAICSNVIFAISGPNTHQLNEDRLPVYLSHIPSGTSSQNVAHFGQMILTGRFQKFDWGSALENRKRYGMPFPPQYEMGKVDVPTGVFWGRQDWLANEADIATSIIPHLSNLKGNFALDNFNHLDFIWGLNAAEKIYEPMIRLIQELEEEGHWSPNSSLSTTATTSDYETATGES